MLVGTEGPLVVGGPRATRPIRRFPQTWKLNRYLHTARWQELRLNCRLPLFILTRISMSPTTRRVGGRGGSRTHDGALLAFDAEDFESGYSEYKRGPSANRPLTGAHWRGSIFRSCCYVTAASAGIGTAYAAKYGIASPPRC